MAIDGQSEGKRQRRGSRAELQVEIVKCFDGRGRKETRSRGRPPPGSEIGKVESIVGGGGSITERIIRLPSTRVRLCGKLLSYQKIIFYSNLIYYPVALLFSGLPVSASSLPASADWQIMSA